MALPDILELIVANTEKEIADAQAAQRQTIAALRHQSEREQQSELEEIQHQKEKKKDSMRARAEGHGIMMKRHSLLRKKQEVIAALYEGEVMKQLLALPEATLEKFFKHCLERIDTPGVVRPAKAHAALLKRACHGTHHTLGETIDAQGGFVVSSDKREDDLTFEFLIREVLKPRTELSVLGTLLPQ